MMDAQAEQRLARFWFNFLPGRFMNLRCIAEQGDIWGLDSVVSTILNTLPKAGLTEDEQSSFAKEVQELRLKCYCVRTAKALSLYDATSESCSALELYKEAQIVLDYLQNVIDLDSNAEIGVLDKDSETVAFKITASELRSNLLNDQSRYFESFQNILNQGLENLAKYSLDMNMKNPAFDTRLRTRSLEAGINIALEYAQLLGVDITEKINEIRITAARTMGQDMSSYN